MHQRSCQQHLIDALEVADRLLEVANGQATTCDHEDCMVLDGIMRDCAMQIRRSIAAVELRVLETETPH